MTTKTKRLVILACSQTKREGPPLTMNALQRYDGPLWQTLRATDPDQQLAKVAFLSARYGFGDATFTWVDDYNTKMTTELAERMIAGGIGKRWPEYPAGQLGGMHAGAEISSMSLTTGLDREPFTDICLVGGETYLTVMRAFVAEFQRMGCVAADATLTEVNGAIGFMRRDLKAWLVGAATETDELAGETVDQAIIGVCEPVSESARALARLDADRSWRRAANLPAGGLFDAVERNQQELF